MDDVGLTQDELSAEAGAPLPERQQLSTIHTRLGALVDNFAQPINEATAINNESTASYAIADADQVVILNQVDVEPGEVAP